jgi:[CysO sulfur-carrier protein]-S-L-cysteine hydrolase
MLTQARLENPRECCGLLAGNVVETADPDQRIGQVAQCHPLVNAAANPEKEYFSDPRSLFVAVRAMRLLGQNILAIYHSHPTSDPIPSRTDCAQNYYPDTIHLIISLKGNEPVVRGWWIEEDRFHEAVWECF